MVSAVPFILIKPQIRGMSLNEYLKAQNKTNDAIRTSTFSADELHRFRNLIIVGQITDQNIFVTVK